MKRQRIAIIYKAALSAMIVFAAMILMIIGNVRASRTKTSESHFKQALAHLQRNQLADADSEMDKAMSLSPENAYYAACKGLIAERMAETVEARPFPEGFLTDADAASNTEIASIEESIRYYQRAISLNPHDYSFFHNLGWLHWLRGGKEKAIIYLKKAAESGEKDFIYYVSLGMVLERNGNLQDSIEAYQKAVELSPRTIALR